MDFASEAKQSTSHQHNKIQNSNFPFLQYASSKLGNCNSSFFITFTSLNPKHPEQMKIKLTFIVVLFLLANLAPAQVKFRVKKLNADSLVALLPEKVGAEKVDVLNLLSNVICRQNIDSSINLANRAINLSQELNYKKGLADGYYNTGNGYYLLDTLEPTITNYMKAFRIYEELGPSEWYGNVCLHIAGVNYFTGRDDEVMPYVYKAISMFESLDDREGLYNAYFSMAIGKCTLVPYEFDTAIYYYKKAMNYLNTDRDQNYLAILHRDIAIIYRRQFYATNNTSVLSKSLTWFYKALDIPNISDRYKIWFLWEVRKLWNEYNTQAGLDSADACLQRMRYLKDKNKTELDSIPDLYMVLSCLDPAKISYWQGDNEQTIADLKQALKKVESWLSGFSANNYHDPSHGLNTKFYLKVTRKDIHYYMYESYIELGEFELALESYILSEQAREEIFLKKNQDYITVLETAAKDEKNKSQLELLASENELHKMRVRQSRIWLIALGGFVIIFVLMTVLLIRQRKIRAEHKIILREQKLIHELKLKHVESKKLKELDHLKSQFFANVSHEFRTPLTLILSPAEKLLGKITHEDHRRDLLLIHRYARRLRRLINQLLNLSKLEAGKLKLNAREENIVKLLKTFTQSFESLATQKKVHLDFKSEKEEIIVSIDQNKLEIVINNLLSNAFKFTPEGGRISVEVASMPDDDNGGKEVHIIVSDSGSGIPEDKLEKVFERFYLVDETNVGSHEGSGIGLALAKELVELHRGEIRVESKMNVGTTFRIILPIPGPITTAGENNGFEETPGDDAIDEFSQEIPQSDIYQPEIEKKPDERKPDIDSSKPVLLVVEDNPDLRAHICSHLSGEYNIIEAKDGEEGLGEAIRVIPDLIISDVMMPKMDGFEMSNTIKNDERTCHIPVILLTALAARESRIEGFETGADDFISKPFDMEELQIRVKNLIAQRHRVSQFIERKIKTLHSTLHLDFTDSGITSMDEQFMQKAIEQLQIHHSNPEFNIHDFGRHVGLSVAQLNRKIKALTGQSSSEFIRTYRLNRAAELIKKKTGTVAEIAYDVGFNNPSYFTECFKQYFGQLPSGFHNS